MGGSESWSKQKDFSLNVSNQFTLQKPTTLHAFVSLYYNNGRRDTHRQDSTWQEAPINRTFNAGLNKYRTLNLQGSLNWYKKFSWGDYLALSANGSYGLSKPSDNFTRTETYYLQNQHDDLRDTYNDNHQNSYQYQVGGEYMFQMPNQWMIEPAIRYEQNQQNTHNDLFRLDWLEGARNDPHEIGWLPSNRAQLLSVIDTDNSINLQLHTRAYHGSLNFTRSDGKGYFTLSLPVRLVDERLNYFDHHIDTIARRHYVNFTPMFYYYQWGKKKGLEYVHYNMDVSRPDLSSLMPHTNTSSALSTWQSNPSLKPTTTHTVTTRVKFDNDSIRRFASIAATASLTRNAQGTRTTYNRKTGAYTFMNDNINGNWNASMEFNYQRPLDRPKRLTLKQRAQANYTHSVDFPILYDASDATNPTDKSKVNNWTLQEHLELEYQKDKLTAAILGDISWRSSTSDRTDFERISAFDFSYGARLMYVIPWVKLSVATDIKMFSRRGYNSDMMNTDDLVWNAELSRSLLKEKLTLKLTAFDLLHQLSNKQYNVNAQGRTETWNNCIPRYLMLTCAYKLNIAPKAKK